MKNAMLLLAVGLILSVNFDVRHVLADDTNRFSSARNVTPLRETDVSPDADFGGAETEFADPSGRIVSLVVDPANPLILYAAGEMAGVWKTVDGARHWKQASSGLRTGMTQNGASLAVDDANPRRLLYAAQADDGRPGTPFGGLWASNDAAGSWQHVDLPRCSSISSVIFAGGRAFAATSCGIATTTEEVLGTAAWTFLSPLPFGAGGVRLAASHGTQVMFACFGPLVYRSSALGAPGSWSAGVKLVGGCKGLAVTPDDPAKVLAVHNAKVDGRMGVSLVDMDAGSGSQVLSVGTQIVGDAALCDGSFGSGGAAVFAARRPRIPVGLGAGRSYDVFVSSGCVFYEFRLVSPAIGRWMPISGTHVDTFAMAIPSTYDPDDGPCAAYIASDGGVFALPFATQRAPDGCDPTAKWARAMSGLHVMYGGTIAGVARPQSQCADPKQPCPTLYLPTGDNDVWVTKQGGLPGTSWKMLGTFIGDAGIALVDPALPGTVLVARNAQVRDGKLQNYRLVKSSGAGPPDAGTPWVDITPPNAAPGSAPPGMGDLVQVMTMPGETPSSSGDYLAVESPGGTAEDVIVQNTSGTAAGWEDISPGQHFGAGQVFGVAPSNGHKSTVYYVLTSPNECGSGLEGPCGDYTTPPIFFRPGLVYKAEATNAPSGPRWSPVSKGISRAYNLYADPYDPRYLYVTDLGAQAIKSSSDGGKSWQVETDLTDMATNHGEFRFDCGMPAKIGSRGRAYIFANACGLQQVIFDRDHPEIRVAAVWPGGVAFSRDAGKHWMPLDVTRNGFLSTELYQLPVSLFYDASLNPTTKAPSLYIALGGGSMKRVDGPFPTLASGLVEICPTCLGSAVGGRRDVVAVEDTLGARMTLHQDQDKYYRGRLLFDSAKVSTLTYHFEANGQSTSKVSHKLSPAERSAGVFTLRVDKPIRDIRWMLWLAVAVFIAALLWLANKSRLRSQSV